MITPSTSSLKVVEAPSSIVAKRMPHCPGQYIIADDGGIFYDPSNSSSIQQRINLSQMSGTISSTEVFTITPQTEAGMYTTTCNCNFEVVDNAYELSMADPLKEKLLYGVVKGGCFFIDKIYTDKGTQLLVSIPYGRYIDLAWTTPDQVGKSLDGPATITYEVQFDANHRTLDVTLLTAHAANCIKRV